MWKSPRPFFLESFNQMLSNGSMLNFTRRLPLLVAIGALVLYGVTLSHGVTMNSLSLTAKVAGWDWTPMVGQPLALAAHPAIAAVARRLGARVPEFFFRRHWRR